MRVNLGRSHSRQSVRMRAKDKRRSFETSYFAMGRKLDCRHSWFRERTNRSVPKHDADNLNHKWSWLSAFHTNCTMNPKNRRISEDDGAQGRN